MAYDFDAALCAACPFGHCIEDRRVNRVRNRNTEFRLRQTAAMACVFGQFVPGSDNDPDPGRTFDEYLGRFRANALSAGTASYGSAFSISSPALAKVEGDVFELMEAAVVWNALAAWNTFMDTGEWSSNIFAAPAGSVPTPTRKAAALKLPRGYDATKLFKPDVRASIQAHEQALRLRGMELGLSCPDIVGVRIPDPMPPEYAPFLEPLDGLGDASRERLETIYRDVEGTLEGRSFLFAIAVKRTTRSDRLYQPLFEANVLKYLIEFVLRGAAFKMHVHMGSLEGADVLGRYNAASMISLMRGGEPAKAIDITYHAVRPADTAQVILNGLPLFPL